METGLVRFIFHDLKTVLNDANKRRCDKIRFVDCVDIKKGIVGERRFLDVNNLKQNTKKIESND